MKKTKILSFETIDKTFETTYRFKVVVFGKIESENTRNYKFSSIQAYVYSRGKIVGFSRYSTQKPISVSKKTLLIDEQIIQDLKMDALSMGTASVLTQGQRFNATVIYWDNKRAEGIVNVHGVGTVSIYGCNAYNSLTGFNETCCISLNKGQVIDCKLGDCDGLTATDYTGNFDHQKHATLDESKLAFLRKNNKFVSGLF